MTVKAHAIGFGLSCFRRFAGVLHRPATVEFAVRSRAEIHINAVEIAHDVRIGAE